jgi:hypothetical protein
LRKLSWHVTNDSYFQDDNLAAQEALTDLAITELAVGAVVFDLAASKLMLKHDLPSGEQFALYQGRTDEMTDLLDLAGWYAQVSFNCSDQLAPLLLGRLPEEGGLWPALLSEFEPDSLEYFQRATQLAIIAWMKESPSALMYRATDLIDAAFWRRDNEAPTAPLQELVLL